MEELPELDWRQDRPSVHALQVDAGGLTTAPLKCLRVVEE